MNDNHELKLGPTPDLRSLWTPRAPVVVMASGCWDLLHIGHIRLLFRASQLGDVLVVGVVSDKGIQAYKGQPPVWGVQKRINTVQRLPFVALAEEQAETDPTPLLERWQPNILVHGDDWAHLKAGQETVERMGIEWRLLPYTQGVSTTMLREKTAGPAPVDHAGTYGQFKSNIRLGGP